MTSTSEDSELKESSPPPPQEEQTEQHPHHFHLPHHLHHHNGRQRLLEFIHPHTGVQTHVAHTPEELREEVVVSASASANYH